MDPALTVAKAVEAGQKTPVSVNDKAVFVITVSNSPNLRLAIQHDILA